MHVYRSRLLLAAILAVGLMASAAWAGGRGCGGKGSSCAAPTACKGSCSVCGKPCQAGSESSAKGCATTACTTKAEFCCEEDCCCDDECSCDGECCAGECGEGECCDPSADRCDDEGCCCDGWFFGNWFKGWNASSKKFSVADQKDATGPKRGKFKATARIRCPLGFIYGSAMGCQPAGQDAEGCPANCWCPPHGVMQAAAKGCDCKCDCSKCPCGKDKQATCERHGIDFNVTCGPMGPCVISGPCCPGVGPPDGASRFVVAPVPPPPPAPPACPAMGPHAGVFHKLAGVMAENAALHARIAAKEEWTDEQECLRAALGEARQEIARLSSAQQTTGNRDQVLVEWIKSQAEASARKDEMLVEVVAAVVELHAAKAEASTSEKLEAKIEQLEAALKQVKEENTRLRMQVTQQRRAGKRVSVTNDGGTSGVICPAGECGGVPVYKVHEPVDCPK
jgi:hypothetical protein